MEVQDRKAGAEFVAQWQSEQGPLVLSPTPLN
jgi:hypothetical protein